MIVARLRLLAPLLGALVLAIAFAGACGGGGETLSLEQYFTELERLSGDLRDRGGEVEDEFNDQLASVASVDDAKEVLGPALAAYEDVARDFVDGLDGLNPPSEAEDLHGQIRDIYEEGADALVDLGEEIDSIETESELITLGNDVATQFDDLGTRSDDVCFELQGLADGNAIDVDLRCGE